MTLAEAAAAAKDVWRKVRRFMRKAYIKSVPGFIRYSDAPALLRRRSRLWR